jgi:hypothetical protein
VPAALAEIGMRAAEALGLEIVEIWMGGAAEAPRVLLVEAGPRLRTWDDELPGGAAAPLAERLRTIARTGMRGGS